MEIDIRPLILGRCKEIRDQLLSKDQEIMVKAIRDWTANGYPILSSDVAALMGLSIQNASTRLSNLYKKGWIKRDRYETDSGGIVYHYFTDF